MSACTRWVTTRVHLQVREDDSEAVCRYLASFDWPGRDVEVAEHIIRSGLPLWLQILRLVPKSPPGGRRAQGVVGAACD